MLLLHGNRGCFFQFLSYLASVPARTSQCGSQPLDGKKEWTGNKLIFSQLAVPFNLDQAQNKVTDVPLQQRWLYWRLPPWDWGGVSFPKNCLCSVTEDKPGDSIAAGPQGSPKRHRNCPNCGWPCTPLSAFTALVKGCRGLYSIDYTL